MKLRDIMTTDVVSVTPETPLREAMELLSSHHVSGAPVMRGTQVLGVVSAGDLLAFAASNPGVPFEYEDPGEREDSSEPPSAEPADRENGPGGTFFTELWEDAGADAVERMARVEGPEWNALEMHAVSEVMTRRVWSLTPDDDVNAAARLMSAARIHRVLVMDGEHLVGIVAAMDVTRALAERTLGSRTYLFNRDGAFDPRGWY